MGGMMKKNHLSIGFIGAGRVGCTLGRYFYENHFPLSGYYSKSYNSACDAADFTCSRSFSTIKELVKESNIIFVTVPDSSIYDTYLQLKQYELKDKILCHCSGALSAEVFEGLDVIGGYGYSIHPALAISDKKNSYKEMSKAFFTIEGNDVKMHLIQEMIENLGNSYRIISAENKCKYHTSLVMSSNLVIGLYHIALGLLEECGFSDLTANEVLKSLFLNNAESLCENGCIRSLTGPVDRNDISTVEKHLSVLSDHSYLNVYKLLSSEVLKIAKQKYPSRDYDKLEKLLNTES